MTSRRRRHGDRLPPQHWMTAPETRAVLEALAAGGAELRFVGGCVRDAVLGRGIGDVDIATPEPPALVMRRLEAAGLKAVPTGLAHGTVTAVANGMPFEITTLRRDVETFGRHARVAFTDDWREDAARRDFTMNALSMAPDGTLYDYFGGLEDLAAGRVRFVGDPGQRIAEDRLRLLRLFRFLAQFGRAAPDPAGLAAAREAAPELKQLSGERIQAEMLKLLAAPDPAPVVELMAAHGVLTHVLLGGFDIPRLAGLIEAERLAGLPASPVRRLAALIADGREGAARVAERWRLSNEDRDVLSALCARGSAPGPGLSLRENRVLLYNIGPKLWADHVLLAWAEAIASGARGDNAAWLQLLTLPQTRPIPPLPVQGRDLVKLGLQPGPEVGRALAALEAWWIEEDFAPDKSACMSWIEAWLANGSA